MPSTLSSQMSFLHFVGLRSCWLQTRFKRICETGAKLLLFTRAMAFVRHVIISCMMMSVPVLCRCLCGLWLILRWTTKSWTMCQSVEPLSLRPCEAYLQREGENRVMIEKPLEMPQGLRIRRPCGKFNNLTTACSTCSRYLVTWSLLLIVIYLRCT